MNYFTRKFTRKFTQDLSANSHKIYSETYLRITQDLFKNLFMLRARGQRGQHVPCIALISELFNNHSWFRHGRHNSAAEWWALMASSLASPASAPLSASSTAPLSPTPSSTRSFTILNHLIFFYIITKENKIK